MNRARIILLFFLILVFILVFSPATHIRTHTWVRALADNPSTFVSEYTVYVALLLSLFFSTSSYTFIIICFLTAYVHVYGSTNVSLPHPLYFATLGIWCGKQCGRGSHVSPYFKIEKPRWRNLHICTMCAYTELDGSRWMLRVFCELD